jgi:DNA-binding CsgD family transcriptional regulator
VVGRKAEDTAQLDVAPLHSRDAVILFERDHHLEVFKSVFSQSVPSHSGCLLIEGGWGFGKTALLNAACSIAESSSCRVVRTRGGDLEQRTSFGALQKIVEIISWLPESNEEIADKAEAVSALVNRSEGCDAAEVGAAFYRLLLALRGLGPLLLAIDDAALVDDASLSAMQYVFNRIDDQQIWLILTSPPRLAGTRSRAIDQLLVPRHVRHFPLLPLSIESVGSMLATRLGHDPEPEFLRSFFGATRGRPEFVVELAAACEHEHLAPIAETRDDLARLSVPRISRRVIVRLEQVPVVVAEFLEVCAINGTVTDLALACQLANIDPAAADRAADVSARAELMESSRPLTFVAPVVQWAILQNIPSARRSQLHGQCANYLLENDADDATVVGHLLAIEPSSDLTLAGRLARVGRNLMARGDARLAAQCLRRSLIESPLMGHDAILWLDLASCESDLGMRSSLLSYQRALALETTGSSQVIQVGIKLMHALQSWPDLRSDAVATLKDLTPRLDDVDPDLQLEFELGLSLLSRHPAQRSASVVRIETLLSRTDASSPTIRTARSLIDIHHFESDPDLSARNVVELLGSVIDPKGMLSNDSSSKLIQSQACRILLSADDFGNVDRMLQIALNRARSLGESNIEDEVLRLVILSELWQGSLDEVTGAYQRHRVLGATWPSRPIVGVIDLMVAQGNATQALQMANSFDVESIEEPLERSEAHIERGRLLATCSQAGKALGEFELANDIASRAGISNQAMVGWRPPAVAALVSLGRWSEARSLAEETLAFARSFGAPRSLGTAYRAMAVSALDLNERITWLGDSVEVLKDSPARLEAAESMIGLGAALVERQDLDRARNLLREGATIASTCKAHRLVETAGLHLRAAGARPRRLGSTGVDSLTPAEVRAVSMAAANATNREIAEQLFVNTKTIEGHLSRAYKKLGITSRSELAGVLKSQRRYPIDEAGAQTPSASHE